MSRWRTGIFLILCISCLAGFSYIKDTGRAYSPDNCYNPLLMNYIETAFRETGSSAVGAPQRLIHFILTARYVEMEWTPMKALDKVKQYYATNFDKIPMDNDSEDYYYKLKNAEYYLVYEEMIEERYYLCHLYEFVLDEPDTGIGHTVTYGWYVVDKVTGEISER